jgi:hypothetical protein
MTDNETPREAPPAGTEVEHLAGALDRLRADTGTRVGPPSHGEGGPAIGQEPADPRLT